MTDAIRYEWVRIRTIRSTWWLSVIALVFGVGLSTLVAMGTHFALSRTSRPRSRTWTDSGPPSPPFASFGVPDFVAYLLAMVSVFAWGHEYRHGMVRATLTAVGPGRRCGRRSSWWSAPGCSPSRC